MSSGYNRTMNFIKAIRACFDKYACIEGRASRMEYWCFILMVAIVYYLIFIMMAFGLSTETAACLALFWTVISFLPLVSVSVRRLHDTHHHSTVILQTFIPALLLLILSFVVRQKQMVLSVVSSVVAAILLLYYFYIMALPSAESNGSEELS